MKRVELKNIIFGYTKKFHLFENLSFTIENDGNDGLIVALMGASGCGKTTLLRLLLGLVKSQVGEITFDTFNPVISYVPQEPVLFEHLSPFENATYFKHLKSFKERFNQDLFDNLVGVLELSDVLLNSKSVNEISGGQKQKLSLLRALSIQPHLLLLDEPCNGIDNELKRSFLIHLRKIVTKQNIIAIYITHQPHEAKLVADELIFMLNPNGKFDSKAVYHDSIKNAFSIPSDIQVARFLFSPFINEYRVNFDSTKDKMVFSVDDVNGTAVFPTQEISDFDSKRHLEFEKEILSVYKGSSENFLIFTNELKSTNELPFKYLIYDQNGKLISFR